MRRWQAVVSLLSGLLIVGAAFAHALAGWPQLQAALRSAGAPEDLVRGLAIGWYWGSTSMFAMGLIAILTGRSGLRSGRASRTSIGVVSLAFALFGVMAFLGAGLAPHFLLFVFLGLMLGIAALPLRSEDDRPSKTG